MRSRSINCYVIFFAKPFNITSFSTCHLAPLNTSNNPPLSNESHNYNATTSPCSSPLCPHPPHPPTAASTKTPRILNHPQLLFLPRPLRPSERIPRCTFPPPHSLLVLPPLFFSPSAFHATNLTLSEIQRNFFLTITALPLGLALYTFSTSDTSSTPWLTRVIHYYSDYKDEWTRRNELHTRAVEEAAFDRNLFLNSNMAGKGGRERGGYELIYPE